MRDILTVVNGLLEVIKGSGMTLQEASAAMQAAQALLRVEADLPTESQKAEPVVRP